MSEPVLISLIEFMDHLVARGGHLSKEEALMYLELVRLVGVYARVHRLAIETMLESQND